MKTPSPKVVIIQPKDHIVAMAGITLYPSKTYEATKEGSEYAVRISDRLTVYVQARKVRDVTKARRVVTSPSVG